MNDTGMAPDKGPHSLKVRAYADIPGVNPWSRRRSIRE
jgi:hypothetical protein